MTKTAIRVSSAAFIAVSLCAHGADFHDWAKTPPMGWNSWDCIARSPLIFGGDMTKLDKFTLDLLTNTAVVAINQASENNRQLWRMGDHVVWTADVPGSKDKYIAVFNAETEGDVNGRKVPAEAEIAVDMKEIGFAGPVVATELWTGKTLKLSEPVLRQSVKCHDCAVYRISPRR